MLFKDLLLDKTTHLDLPNLSPTIGQTIIMLGLGPFMSIHYITLLTVSTR